MTGRAASGRVEALSNAYQTDARVAWLDDVLAWAREARRSMPKG